MTLQLFLQPALRCKVLCWTALEKTALLVEALNGASSHGFLFCYSALSLIIRAFSGVFPIISPLASLAVACLLNFPWKKMCFSFMFSFLHFKTPHCYSKKTLSLKAETQKTTRIFKGFLADRGTKTPCLTLIPTSSSTGLTF